MLSEQIRVLDHIVEASSSSLGNSIDSSNSIQHPFYNAHFLSSLETSGAVSESTGWQPQHLELSLNDSTAVFPGYLKHHSYGEYIFDWSIADAVSRMGLNYYPKWVMQFPFTPIMFPDIISEDFISLFFNGIEGYLHEQSLLTTQLLYIPDAWLPFAEQHKGLVRQSIEFNWHNRHYSDFNDFLSNLKSKKAKNIRQERRKVANAGYHIECFTGELIEPLIIDRFLPFYKMTYLKRSGHQGYLNADMFQQWLLNIRDNVVVFIAQKENQDVAASLMVFDDTTLFGRYWGSYASADLLHFECCYYLGIEFCIKNGLQRFNPGVQGEHKVTRGFEPSFSHSYYRYRDINLQHAIARAFAEEAQQLIDYRDYLKDRLPFK